MKKIILLFLFSPMMALGYIGTDQGNGGDAYSMQFVEVGQKLLQMMRMIQLTDLDIGAFSKALEQTKVESTDEKLVLNGFPKDAINYPQQKRIVFNRSRWADISVKYKIALVLHEYLGIMGIEDADYRITKQLIGKLPIDAELDKDTRSIWILCASDETVVNLYYDRLNANGPTTRVTYLYNEYTFMGSFPGLQASSIQLRDPSKSNFYGFSGAVSFNQDTLKLTVIGELEISDAGLLIQKTLDCQIKNGR